MFWRVVCAPRADRCCKSTDEIVGRTFALVRHILHARLPPDPRFHDRRFVYNVGFFNADYQTATTDAYRPSYQNSFYESVLLKGILS